MTIGLGIDIGGTKILACAVRDDGELVVEERFSTADDRAALLDTLRHIVTTMARRIESLGGDLRAVGFGLPGLVDADGVLREAPNLVPAIGLDIRAELLPRLGRRWQSDKAHHKIAIDNDVTCATEGERAFGAARGVQDAVVVAIGTGIGGGIISQGRLMRGAFGFAGEFGHMTIDVSGAPCQCGARGCWEQYASGTGLERLAREAIALGRAHAVLELAGGDPASVRGEDVVEAVQQGDADACELVSSYARYLAIGLNNIAEVLDTERIILGGGLVSSAEVLFLPAMALFRNNRRGTGPQAVEVVLAQLEERAGAMGAAAFALGVGS